MPFLYRQCQRLLCKSQSLSIVFLSQNLASVSNHTLCASASAASISSHWDCLLQFLYILKVFQGALQFPSIDSLCGFPGVLERYSKVRATALCRLSDRNSVSRSVSNLEYISHCNSDFGRSSYHVDEFEKVWWLIVCRLQIVVSKLSLTAKFDLVRQESTARWNSWLQRSVAIALDWVRLASEFDISTQTLVHNVLLDISRALPLHVDHQWGDSCCCFLLSLYVCMNHSVCPIFVRWSYPDTLPRSLPIITRQTHSMTCPSFSIDLHTLGLSQLAYFDIIWARSSFQKYLIAVRCGVSLCSV